MRSEGAKICIVQDGRERCMDLGSDILKETSPLRKLVIGLAVAFIAIFAVVTTLTWLEGSVGYDVISALQFAGICLVFPAVFIVFVTIIYYVAKTVKVGDSTINTLVVVLLIVGLGVAAYFIYFWWAIPALTDLWSLMVGSW